jgi:hypothetical protein
LRALTTNVHAGLPCFELLFFAHDLVVGGTAREAALFGGELEGFFAVEFGLADEFFDTVGEALRGIGVRARRRELQGRLRA